MKKLLVILMTAIMVMTFSVPAAFAAEGDPGSITINDAKAGNKYTIYKILDLESYSVDDGTYAYKLTNDAWADFFKAEGAPYVEINEKGNYVTWKGDTSESRRAEFAKLALAYAKSNEAVKSVATITCEEDGDVVFNNLALGYYLVDSSMGALCGLTTTNPGAYITAKNGVPTITKQVQEDLGETWGKTNTAELGQDVAFRAEIKVHAGAQNYVMHDEMTGFDLETIKVTSIVHLKSNNTDKKYEGTGIDNIADVKLSTECTDGCSFEVVFEQEFCDTLNTNDWIYVYYQAKLDSSAVIGKDPGNPNEVWLDYGEGHTTAHDKTTTYTFGFDIIKTDPSNKLIDDAVFEIYTSATGGNPVGLVADKYLNDDPASRVIEYRLATEKDTEGVVTQFEAVNGAIRIDGFDNGDYYLEEIEAPAGYNKLTERVKFTISDSNLYASFSGNIYSVNSGIQIVNNTGSMLPETGGMGTTIFLLIGGIAVLGAAVALFARRRASQYE